MLAKLTTQWRVSSGAGSSKKRGSKKRGGRLPSRGLAARLAALPASSSGKHQYDGSKRGEMGKLVQEIHQMVSKLHRETDNQKSSRNSQGLFSSPTFGNGFPKTAAASSFLNKRGLEPEYHDPVDDKIDEILAMIRYKTLIS